MGSSLGRSVGAILVLIVTLSGHAACSDSDAAPTGGAGGMGASGGTGGTGATGGAGGTGAMGGAGSGGTSGAMSDAAADADGSVVNADYQLFLDILAGKVLAADGLVAVAQSGGWPIEVPGGFLFARLDDGKGPYELAGDHEGWQGTAMKAEAGLYWLVAQVPSPEEKKYKFVDGQTTFAADPMARRYGYDQFGEFSLVRSGAIHLERWPGIGGMGLPARTLRVRVPASAATHHLYVHDGQNLFDPNAMFGGWKLGESLGASTLAIGIDNAGAARMDEYTHVPDVIGGSTVGGKGDAYADYVKDVVRPLIEKSYGKPQRVGVMGSSLGGLIAFHQVLRHPGAWDFAASLSGTFGWGSIGTKNETLIERWQKTPKQSTKLYLDSGGGPGSGCVDSDADGIMDDSPNAADNYCETVQLRDVLTSSGYAVGTELWHWWEADAPHNEAAWAARVWRPVQYFEAL